MDSPLPPAKPDPRRLTLRGGALCLDFLNTVDPRTGVNDVDYLGSYADLVAWGAHAGAIGEPGAARLAALAGAQPAAAHAVLTEALELREALLRVFSAAAASEDPNPTDLVIVNRWLGRSLAHARLAPSGAGQAPYELDWEPAPVALDRVLWPVMRSAADLLASADLSRVRVCASDDCGWAFLDVSKNRSRRWCTMDVCGNRAKARRHYARHRRPARRAGS